MRLVTYARTSPGVRGDSLDAQAERCAEWADDQRHEIVAVYRDENLSGSLSADQRPGLAAALDAIQHGEADGLVCHRLDRIARALHEQEAILSAAWAAGDHVIVAEAVEGVLKRDDPADPYRTFARQVMGAAAQLERSMIVARMQGGRKRKAARSGYIGGRRTYGYAVVDSRLVPVETEQAVLREIGRLRASGITLAQIAADLNARGVPTAVGGRWHPSSVRNVAMREPQETSRAEAAEAA